MYEIVLTYFSYEDPNLTLNLKIKDGFPLQQPAKKSYRDLQELEIENIMKNLENRVPIYLHV